jgi:hypothetical protein
MITKAKPGRPATLSRAVTKRLQIRDFRASERRTMKALPSQRLNVKAEESVRAVPQFAAAACHISRAREQLSFPHQH